MYIEAIIKLNYPFKFHTTQCDVIFLYLQLKIIIIIMIKRNIIRLNILREILFEIKYFRLNICIFYHKYFVNLEYHIYLR